MALDANQTGMAAQMASAAEFDKRTAAVEILKAIDAWLASRSIGAQDIATTKFISAADYYIERANQGWVR